MKRAIWLGALATCVLFPAAVSAAEGPPPCPQRIEALKLDAPAYGRASIGLRAEIGIDRSEEPANAVIEAGAAGSAAVHPVALPATGRSTTVVVPTGRPDPAWRLVLRWTQGESTRPCTGEEELSPPIIPRGASAGEVERPRLEGRFRVVQRTVSPRGSRGVRRPVWRFEPGCRYFGCAARIHSASGPRGWLQPRYAYGNFEQTKTHGPKDGCLVWQESFLTGEKLDTKLIRRAFIERVTVIITVTAVDADGLAQRLIGTIRTRLEPVGRAKLYGCHGPGSLERIAGRRL